MGACLRFCVSSRQGKGQNPGHILQRTTWAPRLSSRLCACRGILYYPRNKLRRAFFMPSCRKQLPGGWTGYPLADGPFPRLLLLVRNVVAADLRRATILVDELPKLHLRHI